ncbi:MAG: hypothetical protein CR959_01895 [Fusobacteriales bacterium]|nr:MAG: hypothetical protein CR959_01895 [Fusobacteriales bacterium]
MLFLPLRTVKFIFKKFKENISKQGHTLKEYKIDEYQYVYLLDNSFVLAAEICENNTQVNSNIQEVYKNKVSSYLDIPLKENEKYYDLIIEELTYNEIGFNYDHTDFIREMKTLTQIDDLDQAITYTNFLTYRKLFAHQNPEKYYDEKIPELKLKERYENWKGLKYYFIIFEMQGFQAHTERIIAYTTSNPEAYVQNFCKTIIDGKRHYNRGNVRGYCDAFHRNVLSWEDKQTKEKLKKYFTYFIVESYHKDKSETWLKADEILEGAYTGIYDDVKRNKF